MISLDDVAGRATITVPEAGQVLGIGRDAAYAAAERGEIPVLKLGRRLVVPVPKLLQLLGVAPEHTEAGPSQDPATATDSPSPMELRHVDGRAPAVAPASNVHPIRGM